MSEITTTTYIVDPTTSTLVKDAHFELLKTNPEYAVHYRKLFLASDRDEPEESEDGLESDWDYYGGLVIDTLHGHATLADKDSSDVAIVVDDVLLKQYGLRRDEEAKIAFTEQPVHDGGVVVGHLKIKTTSEVDEFVPRPKEEIKADRAALAALAACRNDLTTVNDSLRNLQTRVQKLTSQQRSKLSDQLVVCSELVDQLQDW